MIARAELRKLLTLPSVGLTVVLTLAVQVLLSAVTREALTPLGYTQAGFLVLGALAVASEHQGGDQIRVSFLATPQRVRLFAAKLLMVCVVSVPFAAVTAAISAVWADEAGRIPAATAYLTLTALFAAAVAAMVRRVEGAIVLLLVVHFVVGPSLRARFEQAARFLPDTAVFEPVRGMPATIIWTVVAALAAAVVFDCRDA